MPGKTKGRNSGLFIVFNINAGIISDTIVNDRSRGSSLRNFSKQSKTASQKLQYVRNAGFRTANPALLFKALANFSMGGAGPHWQPNQLICIAGIDVGPP